MSLTKILLRVYGSDLQYDLIAQRSFITLNLGLYTHRSDTLLAAYDLTGFFLSILLPRVS